MYDIVEVDGSDPDIAKTLHHFNSLAPELFPELSESHLLDGYWWIVYHGDEPVAFAGLVSFEIGNVSYFKRCYVLPDHRGRDLQIRLMAIREFKARELRYFQIVSECAATSRSNANFRRRHFEMFDPEQPWGKPGDIYWRKTL